MAEKLSTIEYKETLKPLKILVINDDNITLTDIAVALPSSLKKGEDVIFVSSYEKAISAIKENDFTIIFLDHNLTPNGGEGFKILEVIQKKEQNEGKKIKVYSTTKDEKIQKQYKEKGIKWVSEFKIAFKIGKILNHKKI